MARGRGAYGGGRRPVNLTGTISGGERDDLVALLSNITDVVAHRMTGFFVLPPGRPGTRDSNVSDASSKENIAPSSKSLCTTSSGASTKADPIDENDPAVLKELRKEMLAFFRKWQVALANRCRDLEVIDPPVETVEVKSAGRAKARNGRNNGRGARAPQSKPVPVGSRTVYNGNGPVATPSYGQTDPALRHYPPIATPLWHLPLERRRLLMTIVMLVVISLEDYSAYGRTVMMYVASSLNMPLRAVQEDEVRFGRCLGKIALDFANGEMARRISEGAEMPRGRQTGPNRANDTEFLAGPISESTIGRPPDASTLTGNNTIELLGQLGDNGVAMGSLFAFYGAKATGKTMDAYAKDVQDFALLPIKVQDKQDEPMIDTRSLHHHDRRLRMCICINGSILKPDEQAQDPWHCLGNQAEVYALRWETNSLRSLGSCMQMVASSRGWKQTRAHFKQHSIIDAFKNNKWPSCLDNLSKIIDNPWTVGIVRADKVGIALADTIQRKVQGGRPVSLIGFGLGARSIYTCLMILSERRQFGLVDNVLMAGTPAPSDRQVWVTLKSVVNGRLINVFCPTDYMLPFMYRLCDTRFGLAGIQAVEGCDGVENIEIPDMPSGHLSYQYTIGRVMQKASWEDIDHETVAKEAFKIRELDLKFAPDSVIPVSKANNVAAKTIPAKTMAPTIAAVVAGNGFKAEGQGPLKPVNPATLNERRPAANGRNGPPVPLTINTNTGPSRLVREPTLNSRGRSNSTVSNNSRSSYVTTASSVPLASSGSSINTTRSGFSSASSGGVEVGVPAYTPVGRRRDTRGGGGAGYDGYDERPPNGRNRRGGNGRRDLDSRGGPRGPAPPSGNGNGFFWDVPRAAADPMESDFVNSGHYGQPRNSGPRQYTGNFNQANRTNRFGAIGEPVHPNRGPGPGPGSGPGSGSGSRRRKNGGGRDMDVHPNEMHLNGVSINQDPGRFDDSFKPRRTRRGTRGSGNGGANRVMQGQS